MHQAACADIHIGVYFIVALKPLVCLGSSREELRGFSVEARGRAGYELYLVQLGLEPKSWKPMGSIGPGVREIRVRVGREFRIIYLASLPEAVYVLHAFEKKAQKTARRDLALARQRLADLLRTRQSRR